MGLLLTGKKIDLRKIYVPNTTQLSIVRSRILTQVYRSLKVGFKVTILLYLCSILYCQALLSSLLREMSRGLDYVIQIIFLEAGFVMREI